MSNFNLSIDDYNINELKDLLNLVDPFTMEDIVNNENRLKEKLLVDTNVSNEKKKDISKFLETVKKLLIKEKKEEFINIPVEELVGNTNHPVPKRIHDVVEKINAVPRDETVESNVSKNTIHKLLCLDSRFRDNYYNTLSTNYVQTLPTVVKNVVSMELSALEFPTSYYQVSKAIGNNYMWIKWTCPVRMALSGFLPETVTASDEKRTIVSSVCDDTIVYGPNEIRQSSKISDFNPQALWYYIAVPDGNYQRPSMQRVINEQMKIAMQPEAALVYLFQQLGAFYTNVDGDQAWVPYNHLKTFIYGWCAYPNITIGENSLKTVISYLQGNATYNPSSTICDGCTTSSPNSDKFKDISFAFAPSVSVADLLYFVNKPSCEAWLHVCFNRVSQYGEGGATSYLADPVGTNSRYNAGQVNPPAMDIKPDQGIVSNFGWVLGYRLGEYEASTAYVSEGCYDAWGIKYIYIVVNDYNKNVNNFCIPSYNESLGKTNVLARISTSAVASQDFGNGINLTNNINNDTTIRKRFYFGPVDISKLELQITDEFGRILDLNNMDYSMAINFICLYD